MYYLERSILTLVGIGCFISIWFIPRNKRGKASFVFLLTQFFSWVFGLVVVEFALLDYPVREFAKANATSFMFEYFVLPILTVFFVLYYPFNKPLKSRVFYYSIFSSGFTLIEVLLEKYTLLIEYHEWEWYWTWISMSLIFYVVNTIYKWFYKIENVLSL